MISHRYVPATASAARHILLVHEKLEESESGMLRVVAGRSSAHDIDSVCERGALMRHSASFRNDPLHNHVLEGFALNVRNLAVQLVPPALLRSDASHVALASIREECVVVCVDHNEARRWAHTQGADVVVFGAAEGFTQTFASGASQTVEAAFREHEARGLRVRTLLIDDVHANKDAMRNPARWSQVQGVVGLARLLLELRRKQAKVFLVPVNEANAQTVLLLSLALVLMSPTYFSAGSDLGARPETSINDAIAVVYGLFASTNTVAHTLHSCVDLAPFVAPLQTNLRAIASNNYGAWKLLGDRMRVHDNKRERVTSFCFCAMPESFVRREAPFWAVNAAGARTCQALDRPVCGAADRALMRRRSEPAWPHSELPAQLFAAAQPSPVLRAQADWGLDARTTSAEVESWLSHDDGPPQPASFSPAAQSAAMQVDEAGLVFAPSSASPMQRSSSRGAAASPMFRAAVCSPRASPMRSFSSTDDNSSDTESISSSSAFENKLLRAKVERQNKLLRRLLSMSIGSVTAEQREMVRMLDALDSEP